MPERMAFAFSRLLDTGLLWYLNRVALHPRGYALALDFADGEDEPRGWSLTRADVGEPWSFPPGEEPEKFQAVMSLFANLDALGRVPPSQEKGQ